jgi:peptide/nickel transport system substrate-binding protein
MGTPTPMFADENVLTLAIESDLTNIDPRLATDLYSQRVGQIVCNGLIQKDPKSNLIPDLAERWENPDDKTYIFYLRKGVKFHDGTELTTEDVKYTFETILDPEMKSPKAAGYKKIKSIEIIDPYTIKFTLNETYSPFLIDMNQKIVPKKATEEQEGKKFTDQLIGTGPFKFVEWKHDEEVVFEANPDYFEGAPKIDKVVFKIIPDDTVRFLELKQGGVNFAQNVVPPDMVPIAEKTEGLKVIAQESVVIYYLGFNLEDPILKNVKVRQAMAYAIDRQTIIDNLLKGQASLATGLLSPSNWAYEPNVKTYNYDPEKAKALLDEAGYPDPDGDGPEPRIKIVYKTSTNPLRIRIGEVLQDQLKKVGIEVSEIQTFEWAKFYQDVIDGNFQIYTLRWVGITEPDIFHSIYHSSMFPPDGRNRGRYVNPQIDELTEKGRLVIDVEERKKIYSEVQQILAEELPYIFLWYPHNIVVMSEKLQGFTLYPDGDFATLQNMWFEE